MNTLKWGSSVYFFYLEGNMDTKMICNDAITMIIGKSFSMSGVNNIRAFDEGYIVLDTVVGRVSVEGLNMKIESLIKEVK